MTWTYLNSEIRRLPKCNLSTSQAHNHSLLTNSQHASIRYSGDLSCSPVRLTPYGIMGKISWPQWKKKKKNQKTKYETPLRWHVGSGSCENGSLHCSPILMGLWWERAHSKENRLEPRSTPVLSNWDNMKYEYLPLTCNSSRLNAWLDQKNDNGNKHQLRIQMIGQQYGRHGGWRRPVC